MNETTGFTPELQKAHGKLDYPLTNDYMFRALFQKSNKSLKGLVSSLLRIPMEEIRSVEITNPIIIGDDYTDKEFHLDIRAELNGNRLINLEMQVTDWSNWPERSISYLCRMFDNLDKGNNYQNVKPAVHISILDFTLFPDAPAFYSCNKLMDEKSYHVYSDKFTLNVLDLKQIAMATDEDKLWKLDYWARLFKSSTWEDIKMIASNNEYLTEASNTLYDMNSDYNIRERCRNREEYLLHEQWIQEELAKKDSMIAEQASALAEKDSALAEQASALAEKDSQITQLLKEIEALKTARK